MYATMEVTCLHFPAAECQTAADLGRDYLGYTSSTMNGRECQRWDAQAPHAHTRASATYPLPEMLAGGTASDGENFCRNPDGEIDHVWCYTTDPDIRWEFCSVRFCDESEYLRAGSHISPL